MSINMNDCREIAATFTMRSESNVISPGSG